MGNIQLYLVPTPIGNLDDFTFRAVEVLKDVDLILAEDTRTSGLLLKHYGIDSQMQSFHAHNEHRKVESVIERLKAGERIAVISDAGTPGISDPGFLLVREAMKVGIVISALPGASAFLPALITSGFPTDRFVFEGFLPQKKGRKSRIENWQDEPRTIVLYESPHRLLKLLNEIKTHLGSKRRISVSRELTKKFEETRTGTVDEMLSYFETTGHIKGEFVVIIEGTSGSKGNY